MDVCQAIRTKRAVRKFAPRPIPSETIREILNAGRRAQSAKNMQPWYFIAITDPQTLKALSELGTYAGHLAGAALGVAVLTPDPMSRFSVMLDAGQAIAYMQLAAWELGIGSCPATIYEHERARELLGFPEDLHLRVALSFGYPADEEKLTAPPKAGGRRSFDEVVRMERWNGD